MPVLTAELHLDPFGGRLAHALSPTVTFYAAPHVSNAQICIFIVCIKMCLGLQFMPWAGKAGAENFPGGCAYREGDSHGVLGHRSDSCPRNLLRLLRLG